MPNAKSPAGDASPSEEAIAKRAYELFLQRGSIPGFELDDWLQAEAELVASSSSKREPAPRTTASAPSTARSTSRQAH